MLNIVRKTHENSMDASDSALASRLNTRLLNISSNEHASEYHLPLFPISLLPPELVCDILLHVAPRSWIHFNDDLVAESDGESSDDWTFAQRKYIKFEGNSLRLVCTAWNALILYTPSLWAIIDVECTVENNMPSQEDVVALKGAMANVLERPKGFPLELSLHFRTNHTDLYRSSQSIISGLLEQCERWRSFRLLVSEGALHDDTFSSVYHRLSILKILDISIDSEAYLDTVDDENLLCEWFSVAPGLRNARLGWVLSNSGFVLPWAQLESLEIDERSLMVGEIYNIISHCKCLRTLSVVLANERADFDSGTLETVTIPIQTLNLGSSSELSLSMFRFPALTDAAICISSSRSPAMLSTSSSNLTSLTLGMIPGASYGTDLKHFFVEVDLCFPELLSLSIYATIEFHNEAVPPVCNLRRRFPKLDCFKGTYTPTLSLFLSDILEDPSYHLFDDWLYILRGLQPSPTEELSPIFRVEINVPMPPQERHYSTVRSLRERGMVIKISCQHKIVDIP